MTVLNEKYPLIKLNSGITVVNFGSPHSYTFDTGEVLNACSDDVAKTMMLDKNHSGIANVIIDTADSRLNVAVPKDQIEHWQGYVLQNHPAYDGCKMWLDVFINYMITDHIMDDILMIAEMDMIDIILVPYPLMNAWSREARMQREIADKMDHEGSKEFSKNWELALLKMRTCHIADRITKVNHHDRFCGSEESSLAERFRTRRVIFDTVNKEIVGE